MLNLSSLKPKVKRKSRRRVGRGTGSGHGAYSGRGIKGQKARTGGRIRPGFEGGRMPLIRQIPKSRGFRSIHPKVQVVGLGKIVERFPSDSQITPKKLADAGLVRYETLPVKVLGRAVLNKKFELKGLLVSAAAKESLEKAGGRVILEETK